MMSILTMNSRKGDICMKITKHGDREKIQAYLDSKNKHFTCIRCGCEWDASTSENEVYYNAFLGTWQSNCPEEHCGGVGLCDKQKSASSDYEKE